MKRELTALKALNAFALLAMVLVNILAQVLPLGGKNTAEISAMYPTLLTPIGLTFSIWSLIYAAMAWFVLRQLLSSDSDVTEKVGGLFAAGCALNIAWIFSWHYQIMILAVLSIVALWIVLMLTDSKLKEEKWHLRGGFAIYYAWITAATAIQIFVYLSEMIPINFGSTLSVWITIGAIAILTAFGIEKILREKDGFFGLTIAWALLGVLLGHINAGPEKYHTLIETASGIGFLLIVAARIWLLPRIQKILSHEN